MEPRFPAQLLKCWFPPVVPGMSPTSCQASRPPSPPLSGLEAGSSLSVKKLQELLPSDCPQPSTSRMYKRSRQRQSEARLRHQLSTAFTLLYLLSSSSALFPLPHPGSVCFLAGVCLDSGKGDHAQEVEKQ